MYPFAPLSLKISCLLARLDVLLKRSDVNKYYR
jgi:hypothetical protein